MLCTSLIRVFAPITQKRRICTKLGIIYFFPQQPGTKLQNFQNSIFFSCNFLKHEEEIKFFRVWKIMDRQGNFSDNVFFANVTDTDK